MSEKLYCLRCRRKILQKKKAESGFRLFQEIEGRRYYQGREGWICANCLKDKIVNKKYESS